MDCSTAQKKMMMFIREELKDDELEAFVKHIDSCQECSEELQISYSLFLGLRMLEQEQTDSFNIQHALDVFLQKQRDRIRKRHFLKRLFFLITLLVVAAAVVFFAFQLIRWMNPGLLESIMAALS